MYCKSTPKMLWPVMAIWSFVEMILKLVSRLVAAVLGVALVIVGIVLCLTIIGAIVGIPLGGLGFSMVIRGFFW